VPPHAIPRYYGQTALARPAAMPRPGRADNRALVSLLAGIFGLLLSFLGLPGLVLGPIAYFLGKSSVKRIEESKGELGGRSTAVAGWAMGVVATAIGAIVSVVWLTVGLVVLYGPPPT
jgi:hypothetical protein